MQSLRRSLSGLGKCCFVVARGQHWIRWQWPSLGGSSRAEGSINPLAQRFPGAVCWPAGLLAEVFELRPSSSYPAFSSSLFS